VKKAATDADPTNTAEERARCQAAAQFTTHALRLEHVGVSNAAHAIFNTTLTANSPKAK
jgi:hypothetical protein